MILSIRNDRLREGKPDKKRTQSFSYLKSVITGCVKATLDLLFIAADSVSRKVLFLIPIIVGCSRILNICLIKEDCKAVFFPLVLFFCMSVLSLKSASDYKALRFDKQLIGFWPLLVRVMK